MEYLCLSVSISCLLLSLTRVVLRVPAVLSAIIFGILAAKGFGVI